MNTFYTRVKFILSFWVYKKKLFGRCININILLILRILSKMKHQFILLFLFLFYIFFLTIIFKIDCDFIYNGYVFNTTTVWCQSTKYNSWKSLGFIATWKAVFLRLPPVRTFMNICNVVLRQNTKKQKAAIKSALVASRAHLTT